MRYDCEVVITASDGKHFRWESIVVASDMRLAVELVHAHAASLHPGCQINDLMLNELWPGHPLDAVETQDDGVHNVNDYSEVVRGPEESRLQKWWQGLISRST